MRRNTKSLNQNNRSLGTDVIPGPSQEKSGLLATQERPAVQRAFIKLCTLGKVITSWIWLQTGRKFDAWHPIVLLILNT
jgi:hypothetical protein